MARARNTTAPNKLVSKSMELAWHRTKWLLLLTIVNLAGCGGCWNSEKLSREEAEKKRREQAESLVMSELVSLPSDSERKIMQTKPGHWHETQQRFKSNREDMQVLVTAKVTRGNQDAAIPGTNFVNEFARRSAFPKGQTKTLNLQCYVPFSGKKTDDFAMSSNSLRFQSEILAWPLMTPVLKSPMLKPSNELKEHEFQLMVVSPKALTYQYLNELDAINWGGDALMSEERTRSYHVTLVQPDNNRYAIPSSMLTMTSIAVVVWDDVSPDELSDEQKRAIVDWVHWGGQLVISGPSSWSRLQDSFLSEYLPATQSNAATLTTDSFAALSDFWMVEDINHQARPTPIQINGEAVGGIALSLSSSGQWLPGTGELVAESQVGRGRIVVTTFPLNEPRIRRWSYFSSFFSTGILRRHPRIYRKSREDQVLAQFWDRPFQESQHDARLHTNVRILARDLPLSAGQAGLVVPNSRNDETGSAEGTAEISNEFELEDGLEEPAEAADDDVLEAATIRLNAPKTIAREEMVWGGRGAAWNDYSGFSTAALESLKTAAGIELPSKQTILYLLGGYLLILVPLNWAFFKVIGRLEFAWIAAPILALIGVVVVTRVARLDIGFARRTTEIGLLEVHGDYPRGHLTQYIALYTSLSDDYSVDFPENDSVALPMGDISRSQKRAGSSERRLRTNYGQSEGVTLSPLTVYSNSTEMVHAEQLVDLEGSLKFGNRSADGTGKEALKNETGLSLLKAIVLRGTQPGRIEFAWVGDIEQGQSRDLNFAPVTNQSLWEEWDNDPITQAIPPSDESQAAAERDSLWIGGVIRDLVERTPITPGQTKLFGFTDERTSRLTLNPIEDQYDGRCLVVAHLTPRSLGDIVPDTNIRSKQRRRTDASNAEALDAEIRSLRPGESSEESADSEPPSADSTEEGNGKPAGNLSSSDESDEQAENNGKTTSVPATDESQDTARNSVDQAEDS